MGNPLFNGMQGASAMNHINPAVIQKLMGMIQRGADIKDIIKTVKKSGISPQVVEQALCMASPEIRGIKQQMEQMRQSGASGKDFFSAMAQQAHVDANEISKTYDSLMKIVSN